MPKREVVLVLQDPNRKTVAEQTVKSDEYGTFSATFTLSPTALSGDYVLKAGTRSTILRLRNTSVLRLRSVWMSWVDISFRATRPT